MKRALEQLKSELKGELFTDEMMRTIYATDASVYKEMPMAVAYPRDKEDLKKLIFFARKNKTSLIPRTAGTSLAGQCVGNGIVVDTSKYFTAIQEINSKEGWVRVQPGVVRDELNRQIASHGLFFGPDTSTANRAMIGGMVGNNSCGSYSIVYGSTRDHVLELDCILSNGTEVTFKSLNKDELEEKCKVPGLEGEIYRQVLTELSDKETQNEIRKEFPKASIHRRNTGYAVDVLLNQKPFNEAGDDFNFASLLCGSEGTLALTTSIKIHCNPIPPKEKVLVCPHFDSLDACLKAVVAVMKHKPRACEMMDKIVLDCTKGQLAYEPYRYFVEGDPAAILMVEFGENDMAVAEEKARNLVSDLEKLGLGYAYPVIDKKNINKVWDLRKAGLGLLANIPGDRKAVAVIEDTAVTVEELPDYIAEFNVMMQQYNQKAVHYAHAGAGEIHLRPVLDLKKEEDRKDFRKIALDSATLVKKYNGSLSGEHGDGRVRAEFIPLMVGEKNYQLFRRIKKLWDPENIFNPGKIVDAPPMDTSLRYENNQETRQFNTVFDFQEVGGILRAAEKCNGSGDCRKLPGSGGTMCPSYMATRNEKDTTRARANVLREFLTNSNNANSFDHQEIYEVMDLCLSCKGCTSECPSNVDIPSLKAEFLYQYYKTHGVPLRARAIANIGKLNQLGSLMLPLANFGLKNKFASSSLKKILKVAPQRSLPLIYKHTLSQWIIKNPSWLSPANPKKEVYIFVDEFTQYNDVEIGMAAIKLLYKLGYKVRFIPHPESGRAYLSKGLLDEAKKLANENVKLFSSYVSEEVPLLGIEPSAILSFRDEYPRLVDSHLKDEAKKLSKCAFMMDEFIAKEWEKGNIDSSLFKDEKRKVYLHGHCHQKALSKTDFSAWMLSIPKNYDVEMIPSGCCGMAGSFGYEEEHYDVSMKVGELVLFPAVRKTENNDIIAAPGTSCRHQIKDGTGKNSKHPVEILLEAMK